MIASIQADKVHKGRWRKQRGLPHIVVDVDLGWIHDRALVVVGNGDRCHGGLVLLRAQATSALLSPHRRMLVLGLRRHIPAPGDHCSYRLPGPSSHLLGPCCLILSPATAASSARTAVIFWDRASASWIQASLTGSAREEGRLATNGRTGGRRRGRRAALVGGGGDEPESGRGGWGAREACAHAR